MLLPTKYENLNKNLLVVGADLIVLLKKRIYNIEELYQEYKKTQSLSLEQYFNLLTFLWTVEVIDLNQHYISLKNTNVSKRA